MAEEQKPTSFETYLTNLVRAKAPKFTDEQISSVVNPASVVIMRLGNAEILNAVNADAKISPNSKEGKLIDSIISTAVENVKAGKNAFPEPKSSAALNYDNLKPPIPEFSVGGPAAHTV